MIIPWPIVRLIDVGAGLWGFQIYVRAAGGPGWHWGRIGAEAVHFIRIPPGEKPAKRLKPSR